MTYEENSPPRIFTSNFSISGSINPFIFWFNPPKQGPFLEKIGYLNLYFNSKNIFSKENILEFSYIWPNPYIKLKNPNCIIYLWCPIEINDIFITSLPIIFIEIGFNEINTINFEFLKFKNTQYDPKLYYSLDNKKLQLISNKGELKGQHLLLSIINFDNDLFISNKFNNIEQLINFISIENLRISTFTFFTHLPKTNLINKTIFYQELMPSITLTRIFKNNDIITMGYCELNQRDSFWTSFLHLIYYPTAEYKMIIESCYSQMKDGKIPTTILPFINREYDIDITTYFILRVIRFIRYYKDFNLGKKLYSYLTNAIKYLYNLKDNNDLPFQRSYWADWKDVPHMNNRIYGPYFILLVKAAIKEYNWLSKKLNYPIFEWKINDNFLWNGEYYCDYLNNNQFDQRFHQDQIIPGLWGVIPKSKLIKIINKAETLENQYGLPETYPFYPNNCGYYQGIYHNGGIWPWLSFVDAATRISIGLINSGINLLNKVGNIDLIDYCPNEFINSLNGLGGGHTIQGWNASILLPISLLSENPKNNLKEYINDILIDIEN